MNGVDVCNTAKEVLWIVSIKGEFNLYRTRVYVMQKSLDISTKKNKNSNFNLILLQHYQHIYVYTYICVYNINKILKETSNKWTVLTQINE